MLVLGGSWLLGLTTGQNEQLFWVSYDSYLPAQVGGGFAAHVSNLHVTNFLLRLQGEGNGV
jgi:hypothetical protein